MSEDEVRRAPGTARIYANDRVEVTWESAYCIHYAACIRGSAAAFDPQRRPWVDIETESPERLVEIVALCPTGALHARLLDGSANSDVVADTPQLQPRKNGPIFVRGPIRLEGTAGNLIREDTRVALCRCGGSANKPFCDGTHRTNGFQA